MVRWRLLTLVEGGQEGGREGYNRVGLVWDGLEREQQDRQREQRAKALGFFSRTPHPRPQTLWEEGGNQRQLPLGSWQERQAPPLTQTRWKLPLMCNMCPWLRLSFCSLSGRLRSWWARSLALQPATGSLMNRAGSGSFWAFITKGQEPDATV